MKTTCKNYLIMINEVHVDVTTQSYAQSTYDLFRPTNCSLYKLVLMF